MLTEIIIATILFTLALILYSIAIWSERMRKQLMLWHVVVFSMGVTADALGVWITYKAVGGIVLTPHAIFGFTALFLMSVHFLWVLFSFIKAKPRTRFFHHFNLFVWLFWVLSYLSGFVTGIQKML